MLVGQPYFIKRFAPYGVAEARPQTDHQFLGSGYTQNHGCVVTVELTVIAVPGIRKGRFCGHQSQKLGRIRSLQHCRWNAELGGVKGDGRKKSTAVAIDVIGSTGVAVEAVPEPLVGRRRVGDAVDAVAQNPPEILDISRLSEHATHTDDGNRRLVNGIFGIHG